MSNNPPVPLYCANHPQRETYLRCNRCDKPICSECAVLTPTGYRCKECIRGQQKIFETATWSDYLLAIISAGVLAFAGSLLARILGFFTIFIAPLAGFMIAEAVRWMTHRRRSKLLFQLTAAAAGVGSLPLLLIGLMGLLLGTGFGGIFSLIWNGVYSFLVVTTVYYRLSGIQIR
jgi:hypothetical protein